MFFTLFFLPFYGPKGKKNWDLKKITKIEKTYLLLQNGLISTRNRMGRRAIWDKLPE